MDIAVERDVRESGLKFSLVMRVLLRVVVPGPVPEQDVRVLFGQDVRVLFGDADRADERCDPMGDQCTTREPDYNYRVVSRAIIYTADVLIDFADSTFDTFWNDVLAACEHYVPESLLSTSIPNPRPWATRFDESILPRILSCGIVPGPGM